MLATMDKMKFISMHMYYSLDMIEDMLVGRRGDKKQLLILVLLCLNKKFILSVKHGTFKKESKIEYISNKHIITKFGFRSNQITNVKAEKMNLVFKCLYNTPLTLIDFCETILSLKRNYENLYPFLVEEN